MSDTTHGDQNFRLIAAFASIYLIWGSTYLAIKFAIETLPPFLMAGTRFIVAGGVLYVYARLSGASKPTGAHWKEAAIAGGLMLLGGNGGVVFSEQWVPSALASLTVALVPVWMVLLDWVWGDIRPNGRIATGLALGFIGVILLLSPIEIAGGGNINPIGAMVLTLGSLSWASGSLYSRRAKLPASQLLATAVQMLAGGAFLLTMATLTGEWMAFRPEEVSLRSIVSLGYLIVFGSLVAFTAYVWLLRTATPASVSTYAYVNPIVAMMLGLTFGGETLNSRILIAAAIIIVAVIIITSYRPKFEVKH